MRRLGTSRPLFLVRDGRPDAADASRAALEIQCERGVRSVREVSVADTRSLNPALATGELCGGTYCPTDGFIRPLAILAGYRVAAEPLVHGLTSDAAVRCVWCRERDSFGCSLFPGSVVNEILFECFAKFSRRIFGLYPYAALRVGRIRPERPFEIFQFLCNRMILAIVGYVNLRFRLIFEMHHVHKKKPRKRLILNVVRPAKLQRRFYLDRPRIELCFALIEVSDEINSSVARRLGDLDAISLKKHTHVACPEQCNRLSVQGRCASMGPIHSQ